MATGLSLSEAARTWSFRLAAGRHQNGIAEPYLVVDAAGRHRLEKAGSHMAAADGSVNLISYCRSYTSVAYCPVVRATLPDPNAFDPRSAEGTDRRATRRVPAGQLVHEPVRRTQEDKYLESGIQRATTT